MGMKTIRLPLTHFMLYWKQIMHKNNRISGYLKCFYKKKQIN